MLSRQLVFRLLGCHRYTAAGTWYTADTLACFHHTIPSDGTVSEHRLSFLTFSFRARHFLQPLLGPRYTIMPRKVCYVFNLKNRKIVTETHAPKATAESLLDKVVSVNPSYTSSNCKHLLFPDQIDCLQRHGASWHHRQDTDHPLYEYFSLLPQGKFWVRL